MNSSGPDETGLARAILDAGVRAVDPAPLVRRALAAPPLGRVRLLAFGKASLGMAVGAVEALGARIVSGVVIHPPGTPRPILPFSIETIEADHPLPTARNVAAAGRIAESARGAARAAESLLVLISGGGSAHLALPAPGLSLDDLRAVGAALLRAGCPIDELNTVRKHTETLKGGGLARLAYPADVLGLVLSDVIGDRLDSIASGPLSPDPTTYADALAVLDRYGARGASPNATRHLERGAAGQIPETPKPGDPVFARAHVRIIASNRDAVAGAAAEAERLGMRIAGIEHGVRGHARLFGQRLASIATSLALGDCYLAGGETTVDLGDARGQGGRCQEAALAAALSLEGQPGIAVAFVATDGVDGPGPLPPAGAVVDGQTAARVRAAGIDPGGALAGHDSTPALRSAGALINTGPTGTNVCDLAVALRPRGRKG